MPPSWIIATDRGGSGGFFSFFFLSQSTWVWSSVYPASCSIQSLAWNGDSWSDEGILAMRRSLLRAIKRFWKVSWLWRRAFWFELVPCPRRRDGQFLVARLGHMATRWKHVNPIVLGGCCRVTYSRDPVSMFLPHVSAIVPFLSLKSLLNLFIMDGKVNSFNFCAVGIDQLSL